MAALEGTDLVEVRHFEESRDKIRFGRARKSRVMSEEDRRLTAYHEAGHALMTELTEDVDPLHKVTIVPRGMALGLTMFFPEKDQYGMGKKKLLGRLRVAFGGRVAEELIMGDVTTGAQNDIEQATETARLMVTKWGMSEKVGLVSYAESEDHGFLGRETTRTKNHSEATAVAIDAEVKRMLDEAYDETRKTLGANLDGLHRIARALLEYETLTAEETRLVLSGGDLVAARAAQKDRDDRAKRVAAAAAAKTAQDPPARPTPGPVTREGGFAY